MILYLLIPRLEKHNTEKIRKIERIKKIRGMERIKWIREVEKVIGKIK